MPQRRPKGHPDAKSGDRSADAPPAIPDKLQFKIGEVADITGLKPHVLRYWETEFKSFRPQKSASNHRVYSRRDLETILQIKRLLYREGYTLAGAKRRLNDQARASAPDADHARELFEQIRTEVRKLVSVVDTAD